MVYIAGIGVVLFVGATVAGFIEMIVILTMEGRALRQGDDVKCREISYTEITEWEFNMKPYGVFSRPKSNPLDSWILDEMDDFAAAMEWANRLVTLKVGDVIIARLEAANMNGKWNAPYLKLLEMVG